MENIGQYILLCSTLPFLFIFIYFISQIIKSYLASKKFKNGTTIVNAKVIEIFENFDRRKFYIVKTEYSDTRGFYKYRSKRLRFKPALKVGDIVKVEVAREDYNVYKKFVVEQ